MLSANPQDSTAFAGASERKEYWLETRRPFCNLIFLVPILLVYELGIVFTGGAHGETFRNGVDAWMRYCMQQAGIDAFCLLPLLLVGTFVVWHLMTRQPWKFTWDTLGGMMAESLLYAFVLIMLGQVTDCAFRQSSSLGLNSMEPLVSPGLMIRLVAFLGAGIYEEFLFRLCLMPVIYAGFRLLMVPRGWSVTGTAILSSLVFSLAHYLGPVTDGQVMNLVAEAITRVQSSRELWFGFAFRTLAGLFFAVLYFLRGFGITVGAHAAYDVFVGVILIHEI